MFQNWYAHEKGKNLHKDQKKKLKKLNVVKCLQTVACKLACQNTQTIEREKLTSLRVPLVPQ